MKREHVLTLYDRLTGLVGKLPGGIQKPILRELGPIREIFLEARPARLMLVGPVGRSVPEILGDLSGGRTVKIGASDNGWRSHEVGGLGRILILDARNDAPDGHVAGGLARFAPDALAWIQGEGREGDESKKAFSRIASCGAEIPLFGLAENVASVEDLRQEMTADRGGIRHGQILAMTETEGFAEAVCEALPNPAKLEFARLSGARRAQAHIASSLLKSFSAICGVIALQPIPFADMPILVALQTLMVGLIIHATGRQGGPRLIGEFLGALGVNIGAGFLFREGARAIIRVIPIWGNLISGGIALAGTYAIGRAAIAFFIEDVPATKARRIFHSVFRKGHKSARRLSGGK